MERVAWQKRIRSGSLGLLAVDIWHVSSLTKYTALWAPSDASLSFPPFEWQVGGLASENVRWAEAVQNFKQQERTLCGDILLTTAFVSYLGFFTKKYRKSLMDGTWKPYLNQLKVCVAWICSDCVSLCVPLRSHDHHNPNLPVLLAYAPTRPLSTRHGTYMLVSSPLPGSMILYPLVHLEPCFDGVLMGTPCLVLHALVLWWTPPPDWLPSGKTWETPKDVSVPEGFIGAVGEVPSLFFLAHCCWLPKPYSLYSWLRNTAIKATLSSVLRCSSMGHAEGQAPLCSYSQTLPLYIKAMEWGWGKWWLLSKGDFKPHLDPSIPLANPYHSGSSVPKH